jgi:hypothetical protein
MPYERDSIWNCGKNLQPLLREQHKVFIAAGPIPSKALLNFQASRNHPFIIQNWHGCPTKVGDNWVVPTYAPSFIVPNQKLTGVVCFDLLQAKKIASGTWKEEPAILRVDPPLEWFTKWVDSVIAHAEAGNEVWCAVDTETVEKLSGKNEDELDGVETKIVRVNVATNPNEGITVPFVGDYIEQIRRICKSKLIVKLLHNRRYDAPLLKEADCALEYPHHDTMHMWKYVQSDCPASLGFIAPMYSNYLYTDPDTGLISGAWKHLAGSNPGDYAAIDSFQTLRIALGMRRDLKKAGLWEIYLRHVYELDRIVLHPAEDVGLYVDRARLLTFKAELAAKETALELRIRSQVDENNQPLEGRWKNPPKGRTDYLEREIELEVLYCTDCKEKDVTEKHICQSTKDAAKNAKLAEKARIKAEKAALKASKPKTTRTKKVGTVTAADFNAALELFTRDLPPKAEE